MSRKIYRILKLDRFREIVTTKKLMFVTYDMWEDPNEGCVLRLMRKEETLKKVLLVIRKIKPQDPNPEQLLDLLQKIKHSVHMQSWTQTEENDALWRLYAPTGDGVQISTSLEKVSTLGGVSTIEVRYERLNLEKELKRIFKKDKIRLAELFRTKGPAFYQEKETRLISDINIESLFKKNDFDWLEPGLLSECLEQLVYTDQIDRGFKRKALNEFAGKNPKWFKEVPFESTPEFIESVRVNPFASKSYVEEVRQYCDEHQIPFLGKSNLYSH